MGRLVTRPEDLSGQARTYTEALLLKMLDLELNKRQTEDVYHRYPTTSENREAARERGFQGERIEELGASVEALGTDPVPIIKLGMATLASGCRLAGRSKRLLLLALAVASACSGLRAAQSADALYALLVEAGAHSHAA